VALDQLDRPTFMGWRAGVVHQDVEAAVPALYLLRCGCNGVLSLYVDLNEVNIVESGLLELPDGLLTSLCVACAQQHGTSCACEIATDFETCASPKFHSGISCQQFPPGLTVKSSSG
jgi:hypothetical protein